MKNLFREPQAVQEARNGQNGWNFCLEILMFFALYIVSGFAQLLISVPGQVAVMLDNQEYVQAALAKDMERMIELAAEMLFAEEMMVISLFANIMMIVVVILFCKHVQNRSLSSLGFVKTDASVAYIKGVIIGFVMFSAAVLLCVLTGAMKFEGLSGTFTTATFLLYVVGFMIQGMAEEVLCRGYFMVSLARRYPMWFAVIVNSVMFGMLHFANAGVTPLAIVNLTLFGIFASLCFIKTGNIWLSGAMHAIWNLVQGNFYGVKVSGMNIVCTFLSSTMTKGKEWIHGGDFGLEGGIAVTIVFVVSILMLCFIEKNRNRSEIN